MHISAHPNGQRFVILVSLVALSGCGLSSDSESRSRASEPIEVTAVSNFQWVKYRTTPVDVGEDKFERISRAASSLVYDAWFSARDNYLVINLQGVNYHYCAVPRSVWSGLNSAPSRGAYYRQAIRGNFDCRFVGTVP